MAGRHLPWPKRRLGRLRQRRSASVTSPMTRSSRTFCFRCLSAPCAPTLHTGISSRSIAAACRAVSDRSRFSIADPDIPARPQRRHSAPAARSTPPAPIRHGRPARRASVWEHVSTTQAIVVVLGGCGHSILQRSLHSGRQRLVTNPRTAAPTLSHLEGSISTAHPTLCQITAIGVWKSVPRRRGPRVYRTIQTAFSELGTTASFPVAARPRTITFDQIVQAALA